MGTCSQLFSLNSCFALIFLKSSLSICMYMLSHVCFYYANMYIFWEKNVEVLGSSKNS